MCAWTVVIKCESESTCVNCDVITESMCQFKNNDVQTHCSSEPLHPEVAAVSFNHPECRSVWITSRFHVSVVFLLNYCSVNTVTVIHCNIWTAGLSSHQWFHVKLEQEKNTLRFLTGIILKESSPGIHKNLWFPGSFLVKSDILVCGNMFDFESAECFLSF